MQAGPSEPVDHRSLIERLRAMDLQSLSTDEIFETLKGFGPLGFRPIMVPTGGLIMRARRIWPRKDDVAEYEWPKGKSDVSYPLDLSKLGWGRANMPLEAMFYGTVSLHDLSPGLALATHELWNKRLRSHPDSENEYHAIGVWQVAKDIDLVPVFPWHDLSTRKPWFGELRADFERIMRTEDPGNLSKTLDFYEFMGREFTKTVDSKEEYLYRLSACFAFQCCKRNSGVLYPPAVREFQDLDAYNVAILPKVIDTHTVLDKVIIFRNHVRNGRLVPNAFLETPEDWHENEPCRWKESIALTRLQIEAFLDNAAEVQ